MSAGVTRITRGAGGVVVGPAVGGVVAVGCGAEVSPAADGVPEEQAVIELASRIRIRKRAE
jgi:hypothetical protein